MLNIDEIRDKCGLFSMIDVGTVKLLLNELDRLRDENEKLRACLAELTGSGVEYDAGKYLVVQVHHETLAEARGLLGRE